MNNDETPERLREFRERFAERDADEQRTRVQRMTLVSMAVALAAIVVVGVYARTLPQSDSPVSFDAPRGGLAPEDARKVAAYLAQKGMHEASLDAYEDYLDIAMLNPDERGNVCYAAAQVAIEGELYERALVFLYQAETIAPTSDLFAQIDSDIALCLDKLGRESDLRRELRGRTAENRDESKPDDSLVLAEVGNTTITERDLDMAIEELPPAARERFTNPEAREDLLRNLVAERALLDRALRLKLDEDPEVLDQLAQVRDRLVVRKLMRDEMGETAQVSDNDVKRYYEANKEAFKIPGRAAVKIARAEDMEQALHAKAGAPIAIVEGGRWPAETGLPDELIEEIFVKKTGETIGPVEAKGSWVRIDIGEVQPTRVVPFEQAEPRARQAILAEREQERYNALVNETIQRQDVRLYPERMARGNAQ